MRYSTVICYITHLFGVILRDWGPPVIADPVSLKIQFALAESLSVGGVNTKMLIKSANGKRFVYLSLHYQLACHLVKNPDQVCYIVSFWLYS